MAAETGIEANPKMKTLIPARPPVRVAALPPRLDRFRIVGII